MSDRELGDSAAPTPELRKLVGESPSFQRWEWLVDRLGWSVLALALAAGLLGLWGSGPLSQAEKTGADGRLSVSYDRFVRHQGQTLLELRVEPGMAIDGTVRIGIQHDYLLNNEVTGVTPEPSEIRAKGQYLVYEFPTDPSTTMGIRFDLRPDLDTWVGVSTGQVQVASSQPVQFSQIVYP